MNVMQYLNSSLVKINQQAVDKITALAKRIICSFFLSLIVCTGLSLFSPIQIIAQNVMFQATNGEGRDCIGKDMCRAQLSAMTTTTFASLTSMKLGYERDMRLQGSFSLEHSRLILTLTDVFTALPTSLADITSLPLDADAPLPSEIARSLGFTGITVQRSTYKASSVGVFPLMAKVSFGLTVSPNPTVLPARIGFEVLQAMRASVYIYDRNGTRIATLIEKEPLIAGGRHEYTWYGTPVYGGKTERGTYTVELRVELEQGGSFAEMQTLIVE